MSDKQFKAMLKELVEAHTDLNIFAAAVAMFEGGTLSSGCQPDDFKAIKLCNDAQQRCLRRYDDALAKLTGTKQPQGDSQ